LSDRTLKTKFEASEAAMAAGLRLKQTYPVLQVEVFDATTRSCGGVARRVDEFAPPDG
jgi:hypothetical protein